jgi:hypothetical protein
METGAEGQKISENSRENENIYKNATYLNPNIENVIFTGVEVPLVEAPPPPSKVLIFLTCLFIKSKKKKFFLMN